MTDERMSTVTIENANILPGGFRNFSGKETQYNREGDRKFNIALPAEVAEQMARDGWNIRQLDPREEGDEPQAIIEVAVKFGKIPPRIVILKNGGRTRVPIGEDEVEILDWVLIRKADVILRPYEWVVNGKSGVKAYLKTLFVTIEEDELEAKYSNFDDSAPNDYPDDSKFD